MAIKVNRLTNANIYVEGNNLIGRAEEVETPKLMAIMTEQKALGLQGKREYPAGFDKMEMKIKWNAVYEDVMAQFCDIYTAIHIQVRSSLEKWEGGTKVEEVPLVIFATVQSKGLPLPNFKSNDNAEQESNLACTHVRMEIDGVVIVEFDAEANIYIVNGVDKLTQYRNNLGL
jgi:uncharacterized protein